MTCVISLRERSPGDCAARGGPGMTRTRLAIPLSILLCVASIWAGCTAWQPARPTAAPATPAAVRPARPVAEAPPGSAAPLPMVLTPSVTRAATPELLALGKRIYDVQCAACHGVSGRGDGEAAYLLF